MNPQGFPGQGVHGVSIKMLVQLHLFFVQKNKDKFEYKHRDLFWRSIAVLDVPEDSNKNNNDKYYDVVCTKSQE